MNFKILNIIKVLTITCSLHLNTSLLSSSLETTISGKVTDATTNEPIPFANIYINGTTLGTQTDFNGNYIITISIKLNTDSITAQALGYKKKSKKFYIGEKQIIDFQLEPTIIELSEIIIKPRENPAFRILREIWKRKEKYNLSNLNYYQYESYIKSEISINKITEKFKNNKTMRPFAKIFDTLQARAGEHGEIVLPFLITETVSDIYYCNFPQKKTERIKATKIGGLFVDDGAIIQQTSGSTFQNYNFYENWLHLFDRQILSPISEIGPLYYRYYLVDSLFIDNFWCYKIDVKPKNEQDLCFIGSIWITDSSFALKRLKLEITKTANLNFINNYKIEIEYQPIDNQNNLWFPEKVRTIIDFIQIGFEGANFIAKFYVSNSNFKTNIPHPPEFYSEPIIIESDALLHDNKYWEEYRIKRTNERKNIEEYYAIIDSIRQSPRIKFIREISIFLLNGYKNFGKIELGNLLTLYGFNPIEKHRFQLNIRTSPKFSNYWIFETYVAYGTGDKRFKYNLNIERFINKKNWTKLSFEHNHDIERLGIDPSFLEEYQLMNILFSLNHQFNNLNKMGFTKSSRFLFESDIARNFQLKTFIINKNFTPQKTLNFAFINPKKQIKTSYTTTELGFSLRWAPSEKLIIKDNYRISIDARKKPLFTFKYSIGIPHVLNSELFYNKVSFNVQQKLRMGILGKLFYNITANKIVGKIPYPMLIMHQGNSSIFSSERSYNMMNFFEFISDQSIEGMFLHHFEGLVLNRIPLIKKLKLREVAGCNVIFGSCSKENLSIYPPEYLYNKYSHKDFKILKLDIPYTEIYYGVENIFNVFRILIFHRLTYLEDNIPKIGVRGSFFVTM